MKPPLRARGKPATIVVTVAVLLAGGGYAVAAGAGTITACINSGNHTLYIGTCKSGDKQLTWNQAGPPGPPGPIGPSDVYQAFSDVTANGSETMTLNVPAGSYAIVAKVVGINDSRSAQEGACTLSPSDGDGFADGSDAYVPAATASGPHDVTFSDTATDTFPGSSTITYHCNSGGTGVSFFEMRIVAIKVGTIH